MPNPRLSESKKIFPSFFRERSGKFRQIHISKRRILIDIQASPEQCRAVKSLFTFVEEVAGIRQTKIKNLSKCGWKLDMRDNKPSLPGVLDVFKAESDD